MSAARGLVLLGLWAGCNGPEQTFVDLKPIMSISPEALDFGDVGLLYTATESIYISNAGLEALEVTPALEGPGVFSIDIQELITVPPESDATVTVSFDPETYQEYTGRVVFTSTNDEEHPTWVVPIQGRGADVPTPDIEISPARTVEAFLDTGEFSTYMSFDIVNVGDADLEIGLLSLDGAPEFTPISMPSAVVLPPGEYATAIVEYATGTTDGHNTTVTIPSNDPDEPEMTVFLLGNGGGDFPHPEAVINCPTGPVGLTGPVWVELDGLASTDPAGALPLEYKWNVTSWPDASGKEPLDPDNTAEVDLYADVAGVYEVELVVTNQLGTSSEPAVCVFSAEPEDDIHVELSWNTALADMDLHLTQGGNQIFDEPEDCNYCNTNPDWGTNSNDDDPRLDIDDRGGEGPENINIFTPEDGTYVVRVHYWDDNGDGPVEATAKVWLDGVEVFSDSRVMNVNEVWDVGTIDWPSATFLNTGSASYNSPVRQCQGN
jgi:hypothetical protein